jgi:selenocysteine lyase/cysteine desulfurase
MEFDDYRSLFPVTEKNIFINHAAASPVSLRVFNAVTGFYSECVEQASRNYSSWMKRVEKTRSRVAHLINAETNEIAFTGNTSDGISAIAWGFKWKRNDAVIVAAPDFPSNIYPWMHLEQRGVDVHFFQRWENHFGVKEVEEALKPNTKMLAVSSVDYASGFAANIEELGYFCKKKGILLCLDVIQSLGVIPIDVKKSGVHFLASGGHKWLIGPMGIGILFIDKNVDNLVIPVRTGWKSVINEEDFDIDFTLKPDALRFETGTMNLAGIFGLDAAIALLQEVGVSAIYKRVMAVIDLFIERLEARKLEITSPLKDHERSGILTFRPKGAPEVCYRFLAKRNIMLSLRNNMIRLAPHFYNNESDVDGFFYALDMFYQKGPHFS